MAINTECHECGKKYRFDSDRAGERVPCRECGATIRVPGGRRGQRGGSGDGNSKQLLWMIGGAVGVLVVGTVIIVAMTRSPEPAQPVAQPNATGATTTNGTTTTATPQTVNVAGSQLNLPTSTIVTPSDQGTVPSSRATTPSTPSRPLVNPNQVGNNGTTVGAGTQNSAASSPSNPGEAAWDTPLDPPTQEMKLGSSRLQIPFDFSSYVSIPQMPSSFVAVRDSRTLMVFNLETLKRGKAHPTSGFADRAPFTVSPDGKRIVMVTDSALVEFNAETGKTLRTVRTPFRATGRLIEYVAKDRVAVAYENDLGVYDVSNNKGESVMISVDDGPRAEYAISPGGRYALGYFPNQKSVLLFDLPTGETIGRLKIPDDLQGSQCLGIAFAPEGDEFAVIVNGRFFDPVLLNYDAKSGRLLHRVTPNIGVRFDWGERSGQKQDVQYLSGKRGWMLFAKYVIDRDSGKVLWTSGLNDLNANAPWKLLPNDSVLCRAGNALRTFDISAESLAVKTKLTDVRQSLGASAVKTSDLKRGSGAVTQLTKDLLPWKPISDPAPPIEDLAKRAVLGMTDGGGWNVRVFPDRRHMLLIGTEPVRVIAGNDVVGARSYRARIVDLKNSEIVREIQPPVPSQYIQTQLPTGQILLKPTASVPQFASISNDGKQAASVTMSGEVLIWSLDDGAEVVRFVLPSGSHELPIVSFTDDNKLLTYWEDKKGSSATRAELACWELPSLRAAYELKWEASAKKSSLPSAFGNQTTTRLRSLLSLSPNRKFGALDMGAVVRFFETSTGQLLGDAPITALRADVDESFENGVFSEDGLSFLALFNNGRTSDVFVWDLATGREKSSFTIEGNYTVRGWAGPDFVLASSTGYRQTAVLIDPARHCIAWKIPGNQLPLFSIGKGQFMATNATYSRSGPVAVIASRFVLPEPTVVSKIQTQMPTPLPPLAGPGAQIAIDVGPLGTAEDKRPSIIQAIEQSLLQNGMQAGTRDGLTLRVSLELTKSENETYDLITRPRTAYGSYGPRQVEAQVTITQSNYVFRRSLINNAGALLWYDEALLSDGLYFFSGVVKAGESVQQVIQQAQRDRFASSIEHHGRAALPRLFYPQPRFGEKAELGFGSSSLYNDKAFESSIAESYFSWLAQTDSRFVSNLQRAVSAQQAELAALEGSALQERLKWCSVLKRPVVGVRWGLGVQLAAATKENMLKTQPNTFVVVDAVNQITGGVCSPLVARMTDLGMNNAFGELPKANDARITQPLLFGGGNRKQVVDAAKAAGVDLLMLAHLSGTPANKGALNATSLVLRIINVDTEEEVFASDRLSGKAAATTAADLSGLIVDRTVSFVKEQLKLEPLSSVADKDVRERITALEKNGTGLPHATAVELLAWKARGLVSDGQCRVVLKKCGIDAAIAQQLLSEASEDRSKAVQSLKFAGK